MKDDQSNTCPIGLNGANGGIVSMLTNMAPERVHFAGANTVTVLPTIWATRNRQSGRGNSGSGRSGLPEGGASSARRRKLDTLGLAFLVFANLLVVGLLFKLVSYSIWPVSCCKLARLVYGAIQTGQEGEIQGI